MFSLNPSSGVPIYRQIVDQIRRQCAAGALADGDLLPSVRSIATSLGINPMTVSKAYSQLEAEGLVERKRGVGMVVTPQSNPNTPESPQQALAEDSQKLVDHAKQLGVSLPDLIDHLNELWSKS